jgi:transcriptional regulator with XRE-family HTH domain
MTEPGNAPRARALAGALRKALEDAGVGVRDAGRRMNLSHSVISDWLHGKKTPRAEDVARLLGAVGVSGKEYDAILDLARHAGERDWLAAGIPGVTQQLAATMELERDAASITEWSQSLIPGLLQTSDYARRIISAGGVSPAEAETRLMLRMARRDIIMRSHPVILNVLLGEAALREPIGSAAIMSAQLRHLLKAQQDAHVEIRIVRSGIGWHVGLVGPFVIYNYASAPSIVLLEHLITGAFLYDPGDVAGYQTAADQIRRVAMSPEDSAGLIAEIAHEMERSP